MLVEAGLDEAARAPEVADDLVRRLDRSRGRAASRSRRRSGPPRRRASARPGRAPSTARSPRCRSPARCGRCPCPRRATTSSHGITRCSTSPPGPSSSNGPLVAQADELRAAHDARAKRLVGIAGDGDPLAVLAPAVLGVGLDRRGDVRRQRPRRRRPDHERLARPVEQREADEERRVGAVLT